MSEANRLAVGYVRVSTVHQVEDGIGLDVQRERIKAWCAAKGYTLTAIHEDQGVSAKRADNRPGLAAAIEAAIESKAALVVFKLDRFARCTVDAIMLADRLDKAGADLVSITESIDTTTAMGKAFYAIMAVFAQLERDLTSERTSAAMQHKQRKGESCGNIPYGYRIADDGRTLAEDPAEQEQIGTMRHWRSDGLSYRAIADRLNEMGIPSKSRKARTANGEASGRWNASVVHGILNRQTIS